MGLSEVILEDMRGVGLRIKDYSCEIWWLNRGWFSPGGMGWVKNVIACVFEHSPRFRYPGGSGAEGTG